MASRRRPPPNFSGASFRLLPAHRDFWDAYVAAAAWTVRRPKICCSGFPAIHVAARLIKSAYE